jgi:hypothetical protein
VVKIDLDDVLFPLNRQEKVICNQNDIDPVNLRVFFFRFKCFSTDLFSFRRQHLIAQPHNKSFDVATHLKMEAMKMLNNSGSYSSTTVSIGGPARERGGGGAIAPLKTFF